VAGTVCTITKDGITTSCKSGDIGCTCQITQGATCIINTNGVETRCTQSTPLANGVSVCSCLNPGCVYAKSTPCGPTTGCFLSTDSLTSNNGWDYNNYLSFSSQLCTISITSIKDANSGNSVKNNRLLNSGVVSLNIEYTLTATSPTVFSTLSAQCSDPKFGTSFLTALKQRSNQIFSSVSQVTSCNQPSNWMSNNQGLQAGDIAGLIAGIVIFLCLCSTGLYVYFHPEGSDKFNETFNIKASPRSASFDDAAYADPSFEEVHRGASPAQVAERRAAEAAARTATLRLQVEAADAEAAALAEQAERIKAAEAAAAEAAAVSPARSVSPGGGPGADAPAVLRALPPSVFRMLRKKGAVSGSGQVLTAVKLTEQEEDTIGTELLMQLAEAGIVSQ